MGASRQCPAWAGGVRVLRSVSWAPGRPWPERKCCSDSSEARDTEEEEACPLHLILRPPGGLRGERGPRGPTARLMGTLCCRRPAGWAEAKLPGPGSALRGCGLARSPSQHPHSCRAHPRSRLQMQDFIHNLYQVLKLALGPLSLLSCPAAREPARIFGGSVNHPQLQSPPRFSCIMPIGIHSELP